MNGLKLTTFIAAVCCFASTLSAQLVCPPSMQFCQPAPAPYYVAPIDDSLPQETSVLNWYRNLVFAPGIARTAALETEARSHTGRVGRMTISGSCGSGSLVGRDLNNIWLMTNAHVATSTIGKVVDCEVALADSSGTERFKCVVVEAAYSSRDAVDWAVVKADAKHLKGIQPIKMSTKMPDLSKPAFTWGCPRCQVPSGQVLKSIASSPVWQWMPNSVGGQSGSSVIQRGYQFGLLTWTWGGRGAGQFTANIYRNSLERSATGEERPPGLIPVATIPQDELKEGYFCLEGEKRLCEFGNFIDRDGAVSTDGKHREEMMVRQGLLIEGYSAEASVRDLPIWADPDAPTNPDPIDPVDPTDPTCPALGLWTLESEIFDNPEAYKARRGLVLRRNGKEDVVGAQGQVIVTGDTAALLMFQLDVLPEKK